MRTSTMLTVPNTNVRRFPGWRFYLVFAICGFTNALFFWAFLPETRGIPLEGAYASLIDLNLSLTGVGFCRAGLLLRSRTAIRAGFAR